MRVTVAIPAGADGLDGLGRPEVLAAVLPGCRSAAPIGDGSGSGAGVRIVVDVAVAAVRGLWAGTVTGTATGGWRVVGAGEPGRADLTVRLNADRTALDVEGEVEGPLAAIGSALLAAAVRRLAEATLAGAGAVAGR